LNEKNKKICMEEVSEDLSFLKPFFHIRENNFQSFRTKFSSSFYVISLASIISYFLSANHNPELRCVICTGVTLFPSVLHFLHWCYTWTALLSANQNRVIFPCILLSLQYKKVSFSSCPKSKVSHLGQLGTSRAQPFFDLKL